MVIRVAVDPPCPLREPGGRALSRSASPPSPEEKGWQGAGVRLLSPLPFPFLGSGLSRPPGVFGVSASSSLGFPRAINNQLRTGTDKGNPLPGVGSFPSARGFRGLGLVFPGVPPGN